MKKLLILISLASLAACSQKEGQQSEANNKPISMLDSNYLAGLTKVQIETNVGNIVVGLFNETPMHRDNFIKLATSSYLDGTLFHRVINGFMVQAGDPDSKTAKPGQLLGNGGPDYTIPAEILPDYYHFKGALAAARESNQVNPMRESSGSQFYIVTGRVTNDSFWHEMAKNKAFMQFFQDPNNQIYSQRFAAYEQTGNKAGIASLSQEIEGLVANTADSIFNLVPGNVRARYNQVGGAPNLDGEYTVFGFVLSGLNVVERIQNVETDKNKRPIEDVKIIKVSLIK